MTGNPGLINAQIGLCLVTAGHRLVNASRENICENGVWWCVVKMSFRASTAEFDACFCWVKGLPKAPAGGRVDLGSQVWDSRKRQMVTLCPRSRETNAEARLTFSFSSDWVPSSWAAGAHIYGRSPHIN